MRLEPTNIQQIGDELAISWNDGTESFFKLEMLRRACPCAGCGGEPDVLGQYFAAAGNVYGYEFSARRFRPRRRLRIAAAVG